MNKIYEILTVNLRITTNFDVTDIYIVEHDVYTKYQMPKWDSEIIDTYFLINYRKMMV